jgi:hypothetical protein
VFLQVISKLIKTPLMKLKLAEKLRLAEKKD